ncbi:Glutamyl-tRNA reductase [Syntrophobotulus glycolicus DSM 8271]|uniref:Glutamyl-tRNA reductase n=1 Tax=Syntrophobotulus glycolicus (strain DSM 8271 / FlGlyR) TaxID=645991 RepID=F0SYT1_SYNGF|nr:glutamyl-tRNA reductase [Syntrophobotulus glycolicus]ADY54882.1 Glutamyl-tRNA reductase [Syntrophobotulus glycolicus DSM 8271]
MFPVVVGLNHRTAPVEVREKLSFHHSEIRGALQELYQDPVIEGAVLLSTCNRLEVHAVVAELDRGIQSVREFLCRHHRGKPGNPDQSTNIGPYLFVHVLYPAIRHLFRVTSGLDSMILGETEILGQVAKAYEIAVAAGVTNRTINVSFQKALAVGKKIRLETGIDQNPTSISHIAVDLAKQLNGSLKDKKIVVFGAGEMSSLLMKYLASEGASLAIVSNRSLTRARELALECRGIAVSYTEMENRLEDADIVFTATSAQNYVLGRLYSDKIIDKTG